MNLCNQVGAKSKSLMAREYEALFKNKIKNSMFNAKASLKLLNPGKVAIEEADKNPSIKL